MTRKREPDPDRLVRQSPGRYASEDGRFEVFGGTGGEWYVTDTMAARVTKSLAD